MSQTLKEGLYKDVLVIADIARSDISPIFSEGLFEYYTIYGIVSQREFATVSDVI